MFPTASNERCEFLRPGRELVTARAIKSLQACRWADGVVGGRGAVLQ